MTFEFASVKDHINHIQDVAAPLKVIVDKQSEDRREEMWKFSIDDTRPSVLMILFRTQKPFRSEYKPATTICAS